RSVGCSVLSPLSSSPATRQSPSVQHGIDASGTILVYSFAESRQGDTEKGGFAQKRCLELCVLWFCPPHTQSIEFQTPFLGKAEKGRQGECANAATKWLLVSRSPCLFVRIAVCSASRKHPRHLLDRAGKDAGQRVGDGRERQSQDEDPHQRPNREPDHQHVDLRAGMPQKTHRQ